MKVIKKSQANKSLFNDIKKENKSIKPTSSTTIKTEVKSETMKPSLKRYDQKKVKREIIPIYEDCLQIVDYVNKLPMSVMYDAIEKRLYLYRCISIIEKMTKPTAEEEKDFKEEENYLKYFKVNDADREQDELSFTLFLICLCDNSADANHSVQLRDFFVSMEFTLYLYRLKELFQSTVNSKAESKKVAMKNLKEFMSNFNYSPEEITNDEEKFLSDACNKYDIGDNKKNIFLKIPFLEAGRLLKDRTRIILRNGYAFIHQNEILEMLAAKRREQMNLLIRKNSVQSLMYNVKIELHPMMTFIRNFVNDLNNFKSSVSGYMVEQKTSAHIKQNMIHIFPPCMFYIYNKFMHDRHLKHFGYLQLVGFLKGAGLNLAECKKFMGEIEGLDKEHDYSISHQYGEAGARIDYTGYGCSKLIDSSTNAGDCNGCYMYPKVVNDEVIKNTLDNMMIYAKIEDEVERERILEEIMPEVRNRTVIDSTHACTRFMHYIVGREMTEESKIIAHPNTYFSTANRMLKQANEKALDKLINDLGINEMEEDNEQKENEIKDEMKMEEIVVKEEIVEEQHDEIKMEED